MKRMRKILILITILLLGFNLSLCGDQKTGSGIRLDFDYKTSGNQNDTHEELISSGQTIYVEVHVTEAKNLDTYEFNVNYPNQQVRFGNPEDN